MWSHAKNSATIPATSVQFWMNVPHTLTATNVSLVNNPNGITLRKATPFRKGGTTDVATMAKALFSTKYCVHKLQYLQYRTNISYCSYCRNCQIRMFTRCHISKSETTVRAKSAWGMVLPDTLSQLVVSRLILNLAPVTDEWSYYFSKHSA